MSDVTVDGFFDSVGGSGAPSASIKNVGDQIFGTIVSQQVVDAKKFGTEEIERDSKTGEPIKQLQVVLQTDLRNWVGVSKVPFVDKDDQSKGTKPPAEDDGTRAVYLKQWTNAQAAVNEAIVKATGQKGPLRNGGKLGLKIIDLKDTGKGNPLKIHAAMYQAPSESDAFFDQGQAAPAAQPAPPAQPAAPAAPAQQAPAPAVQPAPPVENDPWASAPAQQTAPAAQPAAAAPAVDPWTGAPATSGAPF